MSQFSLLPQFRPNCPNSDTKRSSESLASSPLCAVPARARLFYWSSGVNCMARCTQGVIETPQLDFMPFPDFSWLWLCSWIVDMQLGQCIHCVHLCSLQVLFASSLVIHYRTDGLRCKYMLCNIVQAIIMFQKRVFNEEFPWAYMVTCQIYFFTFFPEKWVSHNDGFSYKMYVLFYWEKAWQLSHCFLIR